MVIENTVSSDFDPRSSPRAGTLIFSSYAGLNPAYTVYPQKYQEYQAP